jgi:hypothetical protein
LKKELSLEGEDENSKKIELNKPLRKSFFKNKFLLLFLVILVILLVVFILIFVSKGEDLCSGIENEFVLEGCNTCFDAYDPVDCLDGVYSDAAFLNQDVSFCDNIYYDSMREVCLLRVKKAIEDSESIISTQPTLVVDSDGNMAPQFN